MTGGLQLAGNCLGHEELAADKFLDRGLQDNVVNPN